MFKQRPCGVDAFKTKGAPDMIEGVGGEGKVNGWMITVHDCFGKLRLATLGAVEGRLPARRGELAVAAPFGRECGDSTVEATRVLVG